MKKIYDPGITSQFRLYVTNQEKFEISREIGRD